MEKTIIVHQPTCSQHTRTPLAMPALRKVAGYARVSTDSEEQENSYEAQVTHYTEMIQNHQGWTFAGMYADEGVSGTGTAQRSGFNDMIQDAMEGKFSLIVTKSISRWARNTVDSLTTIRELKAHGCEVFFEKENIYTFDGKGEILITLMSSLAQEESRSISENVTWGIRQGFSKGKFGMPYGRFLGYRKGVNGPEVDPEQAVIVRRIYKRFLDGETPIMIANGLEQDGVPSPSGKKRWHDSTVLSILKNEKYNGSAILQKTFTTDFLTHKKKVNEGELPRYEIPDSHEAIVPLEVWNLVQLEIERRRRLDNRYSGKGALASKLICEDCGAFYGAKVWHSNDPYRTIIFQCNSKFKPTVSRRSGATKCTTPHVTELDLQKAFGPVCQTLLSDAPKVIEACKGIVEGLLDTAAIDKKMEKIQAEAGYLQKKVRELVSEKARPVVDEDARNAEFEKRYAELDKQFKMIEDTKAELEAEKEDRLYRARQCTVFMENLNSAASDHASTFDLLVHKIDNDAEQIQETNWPEKSLFNALVESVIVGGEKGNPTFKFLLRDGREYPKGE